MRSSFGSGAVYAGTMASQRAITFLLLPIFTRVLSPAQYGRLSIALSANAVAIVVFAFGTELAIFRAVVHLAHDADARNRFVRSVWTFLLIAPLVGAIVVTAATSPFLATSPVLSAGELGLAMLAAAAYVSATTLPLALLRADRRLRGFVALNSVATVTTVGLTLVLVVVVRAGVTGWLIGLFGGALATLVAAAAIVPYRRPRPFDGSLVRDTLRRSLPLMPHFMAMWSLALADRVLLAVLVTTSAVGIYSLASNAGTALLVVLIGINQALMPAYAQAGKLGSTTNLHSLIKSQVAIISALCLAGALLAPVAINVLLDERYRPAAGLAPWIMLGYGFIGLYSIPMNGVALTHGRSRRIWVVSIVAAATNLGLIYAFVPLVGLEAAAIASAVGYAVLLFGAWLFSVLTGTTISYPWKSIASVVAVAVLSYAGAVLTVGDTQWPDFLFRSLWVLPAVGGTALVMRRRGLTGPRKMGAEPTAMPLASVDDRQGAVIEDLGAVRFQTGPDAFYSEPDAEVSHERRASKTGGSPVG